MGILFSTKVKAATMQFFRDLLLVFLFKQFNSIIIASTFESDISENNLNASQFVFIWDKHVEFVHSNLKLCLENETYSDVVLIAKSDEIRIKAHQIILHAASTYFQNIFANRDADIDGNKNEIEISDIKGDILKLIIEFCYYGKVVITDNNVQELLVAADTMKFDMIVNRCAEFLYQKMDKENCQGISKVLNVYNFTKRLQKVNDFININFHNVTKCEGFLMLNIEDVTGLLSREDINIDSEDDVFMALKNWVKHDWENRKSHLPKLLNLIKLPLLSRIFFWDEAVKWLGWKASPFDNIFGEVIEYHVTKKENPNIASHKFVPRLGTSQLIILTGHRTLSIKIQNLNGTFSFINNKTIVADNYGLLYAEKKIFIAQPNYSYIQLEYFDLGNRQWIPLSSQLKYAVDSLKAYYKGKIYFMAANTGVRSKRFTECKSFDIATNVSKDIAPMKYPRFLSGTEVVGNKIYVVGGYLSHNDRLSNKVEYYEPERDIWTECPSLDFARQNIKVVFFDGYLYAIGGFDWSGASLAEVERYKPGDDYWETISSLPISNCQSACVYRHNIIIVCRTKANENKWFQYNVSMNSWDQFDNLSEDHDIKMIFSI